MTAHATARMDARAEREAYLARAVAPLCRLLGLHGIETSAHALLGACAGDVSLPSLVHRMQELGLPARIVTLGGEGDLPHLVLPTLIGFKDGDTAILRAIDARQAVLDLGDGHRLRLPRTELQTLWSGAAVDLSATRTTSPTLARRLAALLREQPGAIALLFGASVAASALALFVPLTTRVALDTALPDGARSLLLLVAASILVASVHAAWAGWLREYAHRALDARLVSGVAQAVFGRILRAPFGRLQALTVGERLQALASAEALALLVTERGLLSVFDALLAVAYLAFLGSAFPEVALAVVILSGALLLWKAWLGRQVARLQDAELTAGAKEQANLVELIAGAATIKVGAAERAFVARWIGRLVDRQALGLLRQATLLRINLVADAGHQLVLAAILVVGASRALHGELSVGVLMASIQLAYGFLNSMTALGSTVVEGWTAATHARRVRKVFALPEEAPASPQIASLARAAYFATSDAIVAHDVWFRYGPDEPWVIKGETLLVRRGEIHRLTGASGTGKTTLLRLLSGLATPERGRVAIAGLAPNDARSLVAYVPQDTLLFGGTVLENLRLVSRGASLARIQEAADATGLARILESWPMGLETSVPPGGANLSGGQRQLIVLTGCLASDCPILLLDEAMSHIDRLTQARLAHGGLFDGRTIVTVVHDGSL